MATPSGFLALSGEIRNMIYEYILEETSSTPAPVYELRHFPRSRATKFVAERQQSRPYLGFTQVCRLIRFEFKPLYIWPKPTVPFLDAPAYLEQYPLPDRKESEQIANILRDLGKPVKMADPTLIDILPLMRHGILNLAFRLRCSSDISHTRNHNRAPIVNFALEWAYLAGRSCQNCGCTNKLIKIGVRQHKAHCGRAKKVAVDIVFRFDEGAMEGLNDDQMLAVLRRAEKHCPTDHLYASTQYRMGAMTFNEYRKKWTVMNDKGDCGY